MADLSKMRILVTNDDGINADGLATLEAAARSLSDDIWVVAPETEQSGAGHSLSMHTPLRMRQLDSRRFAVSGTPTDCVLMAVLQIMAADGEKRKPDLILSGINRGVNLAEDVTYSGTVAAAMEGTLLDIPSIAFSMSYHNPDAMEWATPAHFIPDMIRKLMVVGWPSGNFINVNIPGIAIEAVQGIKICPQGRRKIGEKLERRMDPRGRAYYWIGGPTDEPYDDLPGADYMQLKKGFITITPLCMDLTNYRLLEDIREKFES